MGFFSADCTGCGHPLLSQYATNAPYSGVDNTWMQEGVTVFADGSLVCGTYDGYGRYETSDLRTVESVDQGTVWHRACWEVAGAPRDYRGESRPSEDQGYFFDEGAHDLPDPRGARVTYRPVGPVDPADPVPPVAPGVEFVTDSDRSPAYEIWEVTPDGTPLGRRVVATPAEHLADLRRNRDDWNDDRIRAGSPNRMVLVERTVSRKVVD